MQKKGLIHAYLLDGNGGGQKIGWQDIKSWRPEQGVMWVHLDYTAKSSIHWLKKNSGLTKIVADIMTQEDSRPRCLVNDSGLLVCLRSINSNNAAEPEDMVALRIWTDESIIISTRNRPVSSISKIQNAIKIGRGPKTASDFICTISKTITDEIADSVEQLEDEVYDIEENMLGSDSRALRAEVSDIRRQSIKLYRHLSPQRIALIKLCSNDNIFMQSYSKNNIREDSEDLIKSIENLHSIKDRAAVVQEEISGLLSKELEKRIYILSLIATIFLPLTFLTGLLGINVGGIPGAKSEWAFIIISISLFIFAGFTLYLLYKKKWL